MPVRHRARRKHKQCAARIEPRQGLTQRQPVAPRRGRAAERVDVNHQRVQFRNATEQVVRQDAQVRSAPAQRLGECHTLHPAEWVVRHDHQRTLFGHLREALRVNAGLNSKGCKRGVQEIAVTDLRTGAAVQIIQTFEATQTVGGGQQGGGNHAGHTGRTGQLQGRFGHRRQAPGWRFRSESAGHLANRR
jgi:hypothetical protein